MDESRIHTAGKRGEDLAVSYLERHQCEILARNWHSRFGEIDIIAQNAVHLIFLEVKTRTFGAQVPPLEAVTAQKQRRIVKTAMLYLQSHPTARQPRFDVLGIELAPDGWTLRRYTYLKNAFFAEI